MTLSLAFLAYASYEVIMGHQVVNLFRPDQSLNRRAYGSTALSVRATGPGQQSGGRC